MRRGNPLESLPIDASLLRRAYRAIARGAATRRGPQAVA